MSVRKVADLDQRTQNWIKETFYFVEADDFAKSILFKERATTSCVTHLFRGNKDGYNDLDWDGFSDCRLFHIGFLDEMSVCIQMTWHKIEGKRICFYNGTSQVVDWRMIEAFIDECCEIAGCQKTDAQNFCHATWALRDAKKEVA